MILYFHAYETDDHIFQEVLECSFHMDSELQDIIIHVVPKEHRYTALQRVTIPWKKAALFDAGKEIWSVSK